MPESHDETNKLRVMVDANVLCAGSIWPRFPYEVLRHAAVGDYHLVLSPEIIAEARDAIVRISAHELDRLENLLVKSAFEPIADPTDEAIEEHHDLVRDAKDIHVALAAINAQVDYLITQDKDLTDPASPIHQHLKILLPGTFLREHMGWTSEALEAIRKRNWADVED